MFKNYLKHTSRVITHHHFYPESSQGWHMSSSRTKWCKWHQNCIHNSTNMVFTVLLQIWIIFVTSIWDMATLQTQLAFAPRQQTSAICIITADFQRTFHTYLHNEQGHTVHSYGSFTVIKPKHKKISAEQTGYSHSKKITFKQKLRRC
jgi:hypothetical protein